MSVTLDSNTTSLLFCALLWGFILLAYWVMNRTGKHDGDKRYAEGFAKGIKQANDLHELRLQTTEMIADSKARRVISEHEHEVFMATLDEKYPETSRYRRERDQLQAELDAIKAEREHEAEWTDIQTAEEMTDRHVLLQVERDEAIDAGEYSEPGEVKVLVHDETATDDDHSVVTVQADDASRARVKEFVQTASQDDLDAAVVKL